MSIEGLKNCTQMVNQNEAVREKAKAIGLEDLDGQIAYASTLGFEFTSEDMEALANQSGGEQGGELSEEELDSVVGGLDFRLLLEKPRTHG